jgi:hypothetical protein
MQLDRLACIRPSRSGTELPQGQNFNDAWNEVQQARRAIKRLPASPSATFYQAYDPKSGGDRNKPSISR